MVDSPLTRSRTNPCLSTPTKHHLPGQAGLLDRQFRLLREDTVGQLRDAVQIEKFGILNSWVKGAPIRLASTRPVLELLNANLNDMSALERSALHKYWVQQSTIELNRRFLHLLDSYRDITVSLQKCHQELDLRCLLRAHIIGVTATGLARNLDILRRVRAKAVVIEEAGYAANTEIAEQTNAIARLGLSFLP